MSSSPDTSDPGIEQKRRKGHWTRPNQNVCNSPEHYLTLIYSQQEENVPLGLKENSHNKQTKIGCCFPNSSEQN